MRPLRLSSSGLSAALAVLHTLAADAASGPVANGVCFSSKLNGVTFEHFSTPLVCKSGLDEYHGTL